MAATNLKCVKCQEILQLPFQLICGHRVCSDCLRVYMSPGAAETPGGIPCPSGAQDCKPFTRETVLVYQRAAQAQVPGRGRQGQRSALQGRPLELDASMYKCYQSLRMGHGLTSDFRSLMAFISKILQIRRPEIAKCLLYSGITFPYVAMELMIDRISDRGSRQPIDNISVGEIMRCCQIERCLSPLIRAVIKEDCKDIRNISHANPRSVFESDGSCRNVLYWTLIGNNKDVIELLTRHFVLEMERCPLDQASKWKYLQECLLSLTLAYPAHVEKIFAFVKQAVGNDSDFHKLISDGDDVYGNDYSGIKCTSPEGQVGRPKGYLLLQIVYSGNHYAARSLLEHGVDVNVVDPITNRTVLELAQDYCKQHDDEKMMNVLMSRQSRD